MTTPHIVIFVNGEPFNCYQAMSLHDLLKYLNFNLHTIIVEYNEEIVSNEKFSCLMLSNKDKVEIITIVGGG